MRFNRCWEAESFREFLGSQLPWAIPLGLVLGLLLSLFSVGTLIALWEKSATLADFFLEACLHVVGAYLVGGGIAVGLVAAASAWIWVRKIAEREKEIPGSEVKLFPVSLREKIGRYYDFRRFTG